MRYALIDGTGALDTVAFAKALESKGFENVLDSLPRHPTLPFRLDNAKHRTGGARDYLEIGCFRDGLVPGTEGHCLLSRDGVPIVCPNGVNGVNKKRSRYERLPSFDKDKGEALAERFVSSPRVGFDARASLGTVVDPEDCDPPLPALAADLFYVSSHGFQNGTMMGEEGNTAWWGLGQHWSDGKFFKGPRWLILAQCSTLNPSLWPFWAHVMSNSDPPIRMILGYEDFSPAATRSAGIARAFVKATLEGKSMLQAWLNPPGVDNPHRAAIVHPRAVEDSLKTLADFDAARSDRWVIPLNAGGSYLGYSSQSRGAAITTIGPDDYDLRDDVLRVFRLFDGVPLPATDRLAKSAKGPFGLDVHDRNMAFGALTDDASTQEIYIATIGHWAVPEDNRLVFQIHPPDGTRGICFWCINLRRTLTPQPLLSRVLKAPTSKAAGVDLYESTGLVGGVSQAGFAKPVYPTNPLRFAVTGTSRVWLVGQPLPQPKSVAHPYFWWAVQFFLDEQCLKAHPSSPQPVEFQHKGVWFPQKRDPASCPVPGARGAGGV